MVSFAGVLSSMRKAFPLFSYGERHIDEFLGTYSFDRDGVRQQWEMFGRLSRNVLEFLQTDWPSLSERERLIFCRLQMAPLWEKIKRIENTYECYGSIVARHSS
ncbi:MAG: hypothetical protein ACLQHF_05095 [Terracidiphilus sp.]